MQNRSNQTHLAPNVDLPPIPSKLYFTIGEVAKLCDVKTHVLRYWEQEFTQLSPKKRRGNRRYYQRSDILLVREIRELLYSHGFTIEGAKTRLSQENCVVKPQDSKKNTHWIIIELENLLGELQGQ